MKNGGLALRSVGTAQDGEDSAHANVDINVGRAIERVENHDILATFRTVDGDRLFVLFRHQESYTLAGPQTMENRLVSIHIQFLLRLALNVDGARRTEDVDQPRAADFGLDHLGGQGHARK